MLTALKSVTASGFTGAAAAVHSYMSPSKYTLESHHPGMRDLWPGTFCDPPYLHPHPSLNSPYSPCCLPCAEESSGLPQLKAFWTARRPLLTRPGVKALWFPHLIYVPLQPPPLPHPTSSPPGGMVPFQLAQKRGRRGGKKKWGTTLFPFQDNKSHSSLFRE